ncbi:hypothetical protein BCR33DRAFT_788453 [Rhizoclosmatium globosum]|uniref:Bax inhibitor family protein n=1 Tax=Rhizoclosmatium globosum TaxID=329046 RepID=A0A1Y2BW76_9FUNG|nr:hypothetical protein BCR33DRAFT_788453 [Rhizoclosmatium globosum]|eukprot:ORY39002.1 hypothetical protein BCR33DRAFT_788453 [Rhizoclosmatium globosum]
MNTRIPLHLFRRNFSFTPLLRRRIGGASSSWRVSEPSMHFQQQQGSKASTFPWTKALGLGVAVGLGGVAIDAALNSATASNAGVVTDFDTLATNSFVREYLSESFRYVGAALALTASSAFALHRSPSFQRAMARSPIAASIGGLVVTIGAMIGTMNTDPTNTVQKHVLFATFALAKGAMLSPLFFLNPAILARAGLYTAAIVGSLSFVAATAKTDRFLYLGGPLFAGLCVVALSSLGAAFLPASSVALPFLHSLSLYGGLVVFGGFVLYDTQKVMAHGRLVSRGVQKRDTVNESIGIYLDFINIFVRMVQILAMGGSNKRR